MFRKTLLLLLVIVAVGSAPAQWTVVNLSPAVPNDSVAWGVNADRQVGWATVDFSDHASLWSGTAGSRVDLNPAEATASRAYGVGGGQQVGSADLAVGPTHAILWIGTAASRVDLNPAGWTNSVGWGVGGGQQVGWVVVSGGASDRASLWSGTAASWVNLNPAGSVDSEALGVSGGHQVGYARVGGVSRASLWSGSAASWVDLNPAGASSSIASGVDGVHQVGSAVVGSGGGASLWTGTAASWVNLDPAGSEGSTGYGVYGDQQVGSVVVGGVEHASLWRGTAASWVDLHAFLPADFRDSIARAIWSNEAFTYVVGFGYNNTLGRYEALMWVSAHTITATTTSLSPGIVVSGTPADLNTSNDVYYTLRPGIVLSSSQSPIVLNASYTHPAGSASALNSVVEARAQQSNIRQTIEAFNFSTSSYAQLNQQVLPTTTPDTVVTSAISPPANFIGAGNEVRLKISYKAVGPILSYPWRVYIDEATLRFVP